MSVKGISKEEFLREYSKEILEDNAALFIGAGLSIPAGFVDWRNLLRNIAKDLNLDIDQEHDLLAVAQYEVNRKGGSRDSINKTIVEWFSKEGKITDTHRILARIPISSVWTTNYDHLLEEAYADANKRFDVKYRVSQLTIRKPNRDVVIFKMHGDVDDPNEAILTKDDYECYESEFGAFIVQLLSDLTSKRLLFMGFSFSDPNIEYTFNRLRRLLNPLKKAKHALKDHYCILRHPHLKDYEKKSSDAAEREALLAVDVARFEHRINDLKRFGVHTVVVESYEEIPHLMDALHRNVSARSVMISGSVDDPSPLEASRLDQLTEAIGRSLIENDYDIVSGMGKGIGASLIMGAHSALGNPSLQRLSNRLRLFPFPYWYGDKAKVIDFNKKNREEMVEQSGVTIFISGNKLEGAKIDEARGVLQECELAKAKGHFLIPIGATGWAAQTIWKEVSAKLDVYFKGFDVAEEMKTLGDVNSDNEKLLAAVLSILKTIRFGKR